MARFFRPQSRDDFEIALICALPIERNAVEALLDEEYEVDGFSYGKAVGDPNAYATGRLGHQDVVLAYMPGIGAISAAAVAATLRSSFKSIKVGIVVGICGGVPTTTSGVEILLGDVIISTSVVQIDFGRQYPNKFVRKREVEDILGRADPEIRAVIGRAEGHLVRRRLKDKTSRFSTQICAEDGFSRSAYPGPANDILYPADYRHKHQMKSSCICDAYKDQDDDVCESALQSACEDLGCDSTLSLSAKRRRIQMAMGSAPDGSALTATAIHEAQKPFIHFGRMACGNQVMKSGQHRDWVAAEERVVGFEMESAGTWDYVPTIVIKSVCDYADSHKNKQWQEYAAATAAACTKAFLEEWRSEDRPILVRPERPPCPLSLIPFRRDRDFVERDVLNDIWQRACEPAARIGLVGLGGVGKTQLAIEYAYRRQEADPQTWVFWVHASSAARFEESYKKIAERVRLAGWNEPKADILGMVSGWLSDASNGRWAMVVDNADSRDVLFEPWNGGATTQTAFPAPSAPSSSTAHSLSDYLPSSTNGSIVITSRSREVVEGLIEYTEDILDVEPMTTEEAITLLTKKLKRQERGFPRDDLVRLVQQLDRMPLAITQAAAYINQRAPRVTVSKYLEGLQRSDTDRAKLLQQDIRDPRRDGQASNSIITTWHVSFHHIRQTRSSAARLLALMSLFDREAIPDHLLQARYLEQDSERESENEYDEDENGFEDDIMTLRSYSLVNIGMSDHLFDMHRLVQFSTKKWLELHGELACWQGRYISILDTAFPTGDYVNWTTCQGLFPHVEAVVSYTIAGDNYLRRRAATLYRGAWYAWANGRYEAAGQMARASLEGRERLVGRDDIQTLESVHMLAVVLQDQGKYEQAEQLNRRALAGREKELGENHPATLTSVSNLAVVLQNQGKYEQAEQLNRRALAGSEKELGENHPATLTSDYMEALRLYDRAVNGYVQVLGPSHPTTLACQRHRQLLLEDMT
ncbi:hypothetical protein LTR70_002434 [Exophiala xenobiotica]|uniref:Kinesin light chain n=1 Tax=Lithohypha guttulata TaxID=1690604 RepID=A0ABR0KL55_9EURO|nr:hypothetical protein LTR24_001431 [Lithohypha guttulata]KAK5325462.1 hypothetical protein LTR70_002434 [Exophiala xenobiotica]